MLSIGECSEMLKSVADETRLAIVRILMKKPKTVGEINEILNVEQSLLSHHLKILRNSGLVQSERVGKTVVYQLTHFPNKNKDTDKIDLGCCKVVFES